MRRYIYVLLLAMSSAAAGKYIYVDDQLTWHRARTYCRTHFTELAPISSGRDMREFQRAAPGRKGGWVGLYRGEADEASWRWSGGGNISYLPWAYGQPNVFNDTAALCLSCSEHRYGLYNNISDVHLPFFCLNLVVVKERRSWEDALEHCRREHDDLASLPSETELMLARREIREAQTGERVWVGLRHFGTRWLWLQGMQLDSNAFMQMGMQAQRCSTCDASPTPPLAGQTQRCYTCGSLGHDGKLQGTDCKTELHFLCY